MAPAKRSATRRRRSKDNAAAPDPLLDPGYRQCLLYAQDLAESYKLYHLTRDELRSRTREAGALQEQALQYALDLAKMYQAERERSQQLAQALRRMQSAYEMAVEAIVGALVLRNADNADHSRRVSRYSVALAKELSREEQTLSDIQRGALLHDIGKIGIPDAILLKPGPLTSDEWELMQRHPHFGYEMLKGIDFLTGAAEIVLAHHERFDGTGYPRMLMGNEIVLGARIFAVADAYDALTTDRPYRRACSHRQAGEEIARHGGTQFDPDVVEVFVRYAEEEWQAVACTHRAASTPEESHLALAATTG